MEKEDKIKKQLLEEIEELRIKLKEAEGTLSAIRSGGVDAIVVSGLQGDQVFTLTGAEQAYRVLIETMNEGAVSLNQEGIIIYCNQRLSEMIKIPLEKVVGTPMRQFIRTSDLPVFDSLMEKGPQENGKGEVAFINNDGSVLPVLLSISALQKDNTNIYGITVTDLTAQKLIEDELKRHRDNLEELVRESTYELEASNQELRKEITERKQAEEALKDEKTFIENALNTLQDIFFVFDLKGRFLRWNKTVNAVTGYSDTEIALMQPADLFRDDDIKKIADAIQVASKESRVSVEALLVTKDVRQIPYEFSAALLTDAQGNPIGISSVGRNITERKKAEVVLRESEERFRQIAENTKEWIWEVNSEGLFTYASHVVEEILGYKPEDLVGKMYFFDIYPSDKREQLKKEVFEFFATKRTFVKYVNQNAHKNGKIVYMETSAVPILDSSGDLLGYRGIKVDITEYRKLEDQLRHAQKMEAVGTLAGGIAHDFNNILNVIMGYGNMVMGKLEADSPSKENMSEVLIAADRAANLTKRLLVFSRKQVVDVHPININELILGLQKMLVRIIRESIDFNLDLADRPLIVMADFGQIEQVLMNLASNARDAMLEGGRLTIGTGIQEIDDEYVAANGYGKPGTYALITVADTGQGMDAETQKKIFEPFFTTKGIGEGTGLGLAISYGIIRQHDGYIKAYSELGKGTVFKIHLPLVEETADQDNKAAAAVLVNGGNETILVAEDDASLRKLKRIVLESYGYSIISAENGEEAIAKFMANRDKIQLAILDMIMPKKNGKEVSEAIRKVSPQAKILFTSGYTMDIIKNRELTEAGFDFLLKPISSKDLLRKVREVLDR